MYEVRLKIGHPTGTYRRAGIQFTSSAPVILETVPDAVAADPWLIVTQVESKEERKRREEAEAKAKAEAEAKAKAEQKAGAEAKAEKGGE